MQKNEDAGEVVVAPSSKGPVERQLRLDIECEHESIAFNHDGEVSRILVIDKDPHPAAAVEYELLVELRKLRDQKSFDCLQVTQGHQGLVRVSREGMGVLFYLMTDLIALRSSHYVYEPHLEVVFSIFKDRKIIENDTFGSKFYEYSRVDIRESEVDARNLLVADIQDAMKSDAFKKSLLERRKSSKRLSLAFKKMWRRVFARKSRVLVVRVDLEYALNGDPKGFHPLYAAQCPDRFLLDVFLEDRDRFIGNVRDNQKPGRFAEHLLEWGWKIECGSKRGWHLHCVFLFDGSKVRKDWYYAMTLGELWVRLTEGRGTYDNVNKAGREYFRRFLGDIQRGDKDAEIAYGYFVDYLCKDDQVPLVKTSNKLQSFGVSRGKRHDNR